MKNFTNKFKQITSRLSARWLIMALMLLLGTGSAWGWNLENNSTVYFDISAYPEIKTDISKGKKLLLFVGHGSHSTTYKLTHYNGNIYRVENPARYDNCTQIAFATNSGVWGGEGNSVGHRLNYIDGHKTNIFDLGSNISGSVGFSGSPLTRTDNYTPVINNAGFFDLNAWNIKYNGAWIDGGINANGSHDLGELTSAPNITGLLVNVWKNSSGDVCGVSAKYKVNDGSLTNLDFSDDNGWDNQASGSNTNQTIKDESISLDLPSTPGQYTVTITFTASINNNGQGNCKESAEMTAVITYSIKGYSLGGYIQVGDGMDDISTYYSTYDLAKQADGTYKGTFSFSQWHNKAQYIYIVDHAGTIYGHQTEDYPMSPGNTTTLSSNQGNKVKATIALNTEYVFTFNPSTGAFTYSLACTTPAAPVITISDDGEICEDDNATITITNTTDATYDENTEFKLYTTDQTGDTHKATTTKANPTFSVNLGKTYIVKAFNSTCKSGNSNEVTLTVYAQPTIEQTKTAICKGEVINLNECVSKVPNNATLTWYSDDAHTAQLSGDALYVSPATETTYYYQAINGACTVNGSITLTVNELPANVDFGTNNTASVCQNASVNLTTLSAWTKDGQTIQWYSKDGDTYTPIDANQTITAACTFYAKAIFSNTGCESEGYTSFDITTLKAPDAPTLQPITVCPQVGFDLTEKSGWTAPDDGSLNISWYEKSGEEYVAVNSAKLLNQGITQATTYYARVQNKETGCYSAYVSMSVSVATVSKLTITPATGTTTPWVPISYTVDTNETFEMSYPDGLTSLPNIEITQSNGGKTYTYKIPRPTDWGTGNASPARSPKTYTIQAMLSGSSAECPSIGTATVTLNDEANDKCTK